MQFYHLSAKEPNYLAFFALNVLRINIHSHIFFNGNEISKELKF